MRRARLPLDAVEFGDVELADVVDLPSGGDTGYPGFVALSDTKGLLSYHSSHEGSGTNPAPWSVYVAEVSVA